jgi:uncharacterized protein with HEPN domain
MRSEADAVGRIADMLEAIAAIEQAIHGHDATTFPTDRTVRDAVLWNLTVLGEAVRGIPDEVQTAHAEIPWAKMRGMRNLLVHEYFGIDDQIVWETATSNVVPLAAPLRRLRDQLTG